MARLRVPKALQKSNIVTLRFSLDEVNQIKKSMKKHKVKTKSKFIREILFESINKD